jgi:hypothetical protein
MTTRDIGKNKVLTVSLECITIRDDMGNEIRMTMEEFIVVMETVENHLRTLSHSLKGLL